VAVEADPGFTPTKTPTMQMSRTDAGVHVYPSELPPSVSLSIGQLCIQDVLRYPPFIHAVNVPIRVAIHKYLGDEN